MCKIGDIYPFFICLSCATELFIRISAVPSPAQALYLLKRATYALCFALNARIEDGNKTTTELLSFDISSAVDILPADDVNKLTELDSIYTKITLRWYDAKNNAVKIMSPAAGKYKNCF